MSLKIDAFLCRPVKSKVRRFYGRHRSQPHDNRVIQNVEITEVSDNTFFFYASERRFPFATLVVNDVNDTASDLERPGVFRLNVGVKRATYQDLFGPQLTFVKDGGVVDTGYNYAAPDTLMPHPVYAPMSWVCIVSPSVKTFEKEVLPLLREAYEQNVEKHTKREA